MEMDAVSRTALGVARVRARESERADRLFVDPYAAAFAPASAEPEGPVSAARRALAFQIVIRTRFYDDWSAAAVSGGCRQVVLLGAGLDTRAFRLTWPAGTRLFEVDLPAVLEVKDRVLRAVRAEPACDRVVVAADLTTEWLPRLEAEGFDPAVSTAWLAEGLLVYLDAGQAAHVLDAVTIASAAGSALATERTSTAGDRLTAPDTVAATSLWQGGLGAQLGPWLTEHGWRASVHPLGDVAERYGRPVARPSSSGFVTATR